MIYCRSISRICARDRPGISADRGRYELIAADPRVDGVGGEVIFWVVGDTTSGWRSTSGGGGDDAGLPSCILHKVEDSSPLRGKQQYDGVHITCHHPVCTPLVMRGHRIG